MAWLQLTLKTDKTVAVPLGEFLEGIGAISVSLTDAEDEPLLEPRPGETPLWQNIVATALFEGDSNQEIIQTLISEAYPQCAESLSFESVEDREWLNEWKRDTTPKQYGDRLWVYPWDSPQDDETQTIVYLEPGLAFGTGDHPTTAMCLSWLDQNIGQEHGDSSRVMDYGCGSGLLAIAALKLGAESAVGVDIDEQALTATLNNAEQNNVGDRIELRNIDDPKTASDETYDIVLANILSGILIELSSTLTGLTRPGGHLVLTGILAEQADDVIAAYADTVSLSIQTDQDGWVMLAGRK